MKNLLAHSRPRDVAPLHCQGSVLGWPAWLRVLAVVPPVLLLWLAVLWANLEAAPW